MFLSLLNSGFQKASVNLKTLRVMTATWKILDIQQNTSDLSISLRDRFFDGFVYFIGCPQTDLPMIQNLLIHHYLGVPILSLFLTEIALRNEANR